MIRAPLWFAQSCLLTALLGGCGWLPDKRPDPDERFSEAVAICRLKHPGSASRRANLPKSDPHMVSCLRRRGWTPAGQRLTPATGAP
jgi:hypothetical protein